MIRAYDIERAIVMLEQARAAAVAAGLDEHFVSDIYHLISTAKANHNDQGDNKSCQ